MHSRLDTPHPDPSRELYNSSAGDFLGLDYELARTRSALPTPSAAYAPNPWSMPARELLGAGESLQASWPEARPNTWRTGPAVPTAMPSERPSWLLALDDAAVPRGQTSFVPSRAPTNASFTDGVPVAHRVAPWFLRAIGIAAGVFFVAVVVRSLTVSRSDTRPELPTLVVPSTRASIDFAHELAAPDGSDSRMRPGMRPKKPVASKPASASSMQAAESRSFLERDAGVEGAALEATLEPESPALYVYDLAASPAAATPSASGAPLGAADVDRWLAAQASAAAPLSDVGTVTRAPEGEPSNVPGVERASGIWEGATIPVEALSGGLRLETPSVGRVRVRLEGTERVEGRLTAIGQGRVWIQTDAGPRVIERDALRGLEQIANREATASAPQAPRRQRVRTAGGVFYGRVLARDGRTVTLVTDAGTRISVEADEVVDADPSEVR